MTKVSVVLYYWIAVIATLLFSKAAGIADNDMAIIKILIVVTILYVGIVMISYSKGKSLGKNKAEQTNKPFNSSINGKKKKKKKK